MVANYKMDSSGDLSDTSITPPCSAVCGGVQLAEVGFWLADLHSPCIPMVYFIADAIQSDP